MTILIMLMCDRF